MKHVKEADLAKTRAELFARLCAIIGEGEVARFDEALTHPSFANESSAPDNQRLEFLGDAVLGLCVSELLARAWPEADEGTLTRMRSALVNAEALARWARAERIGEALALGKGARAGSEREQTNVLADAVEALVAAVYEARGIEGARLLVEHVVRDPMREAPHLGSRDPKSLLQEQVQARGFSAPVYRVREARGPQHDPVFVVEALVVDHETQLSLGTGEGRSKRTAERAAAIAALDATLDALGLPESKRGVPESSRRLPASERRLPESWRAGPDSERRLPESWRAGPASERHLPENWRSEPESERRLPVGERSEPESERRLPVGERSEPESERRLPVGERSEPESERRLPVGERSEPESERRLPVSDRAERGESD